MSTYDVPGANPVNHDKLCLGCWAEHDDGSLIFVQGAEGGNAVYSMFDLSKDPIIEYRDAMPQVSFEKTFSWDPQGTKGKEKWTWHDKTPFPWDRVIKSGFPDGPRYAALGDFLAAAGRIADSLSLHGEAYDAIRNRHRASEESSRFGAIKSKIARALEELRR